VKIKKIYLAILVLSVSFVFLVDLYLDGSVNQDVECDSYSIEACPQDCVVCTPCEVCSSISCQTEKYCESIGFDKDWYDRVKGPKDVETTVDIEIEHVYETKVVYTTRVDQSDTVYRRDCEERGGVFNRCGSVCSPYAEVCDAVCAYTCDLEGKLYPDAGLFIDKLHAILLERVGRPIEGYDAHMLMQGLPGLLPYDFHGVKTLEGRYYIKDEQLFFQRTAEGPVSSAERMITKEGYAVLLQHLKGRFMIEDENLIIERISMEPDNPFCAESGVLAVSECNGFSSVFYADPDKSSGYYRDDGSEIVCTSEVEDPECEEIRRIMISSRTVCIQVC
jgi:hypothetical protein